MTAARRLLIGLVGGALVASAALASTPAHAVATSVGAATAATGQRSAAGVCLHPASRATTWRKGHDTQPVSAATKRQAERVVATAISTGTVVTEPTGSARMTMPSQVRVPVIIHVIHGRHKGERRITRRAARRMFYALKAGYAGVQDPAMAPTGVTFSLRKVTMTRNDRWFHAAPFSRTDKQMKRKLHRGQARMLNIYVNRPRSGGQLLLGFSLFPWQRRAHRTLDGVTVSDISLPHGRAVGYNLGDTVIHETGHWLGLLHTFEGGCSEPGDGIADTPAEAAPNYKCPPDGYNTCPWDPTTQTAVDDGQPDPIHNFMDYSFDSCMYQFTPGQNARMIALFMHYRYGRR